LFSKELNNSCSILCKDLISLKSCSFVFCDDVLELEVDIDCDVGCDGTLEGRALDAKYETGIFDGALEGGALDGTFDCGKLDGKLDDKLDGILDNI
jgi:hypothetical protein